MGAKTRIDWCDATWNPVTGCRHRCEYCYAQRIARRFCGKGSFDPKSLTVTNGIFELEKPALKSDGKTIAPYPFAFDPTFHRYKLGDPLRWGSENPRNIFVCSMADLFGAWVPDQWIRDVIDACFYAPWNRYLFLTKNPKRYSDTIAYLTTAAEKMPYDTSELADDFMMFGATATTNDQLAAAFKTPAEWLSIEPIQEPIWADVYFSEDSPIGERKRWNWVIIGAETGNRKGRVIPEKSWIMDIVDVCRFWKIPVFMKESIRDLMGLNFMQEFPWRER